jgi:hypothetical protein
MGSRQGEKELETDEQLHFIGEKPARQKPPDSPTMMPENTIHGKTSFST